jgi:CubicO group peptidase (beta-lactamase class C family)
MHKPPPPTRSICLHRRHFLAALGGSLLMSSRAFAAPSPEPISERLERLEQDGSISGLHALLVNQGGKLVFEHYGRGEDETEGRGRFGPVTFAPDVPHDLRSVSKSIVGLVYGVALAAGKVPPAEAKLYDQFPEYPDLASRPGRDRLTIQHVLSMTLGFDWDELTMP